MVLPQEASVEDAESVEDNNAGNAEKSEIASNASKWRYDGKHRKDDSG